MGLLHVCSGGNTVEIEMRNSWIWSFWYLNQGALELRVVEHDVWCPDLIMRHHDAGDVAIVTGIPGQRVVVPVLKDAHNNNNSRINELRGLTEIKKIHKSKKKLDWAEPTHPPPNPKKIKNWKTYPRYWWKTQRPNLKCKHFNNIFTLYLQSTVTVWKCNITYKVEDETSTHCTKPVAHHHEVSHGDKYQY